MAIAYPLTMPAVKGPNRIRIARVATAGLTASPFTGEQQVYVHQGEFWRLEADLAPMKRANAAEWIAKLVSLNGREGTFLLGSATEASPRGVATGTPLVNGSGQTGKTLMTDGWTAAQTGILKAGDWLQLGSGASTRLHQVVQDANSDGLGNATLEIWPRLRSAPPDNAAIVVASTQGIWRLAENVSDWSIELAQIYGLRFSAVEALYAVAPAATINDIGSPGALGFGVGICPQLPAGFSQLPGTTDITLDEYGNYLFSDGSVMVWVPAFYYKIGTGANGLAVNAVGIKRFTDYVNVAAANADGYALHRAFYDGGAIQQGFFVDKYGCSNNLGIASSLKNGNPLSSDATHNPFSGLPGAPANIYGGAIAAAKTRGARFFCSSRFIAAALALLSLAHGQAATGTAACAWFDAGGVTNFPKGNNNNALKDVNDAGVSYTTDGFPNAGKTGSGVPFAKTTHNGQNCGVADLNGNMWEIAPGLTSNSTNYYALKTSKAMKDLTGGNTLITDLWGATGIAENYDDLGATIGAAQASLTQKVYGNAAQVLSESVTGNNWQWTGLGGPLVGGVGGTNLFGNDGFWDFRPNELCPISGGGWDAGSAAGVWALYLANVRGSSATDVGFRAASYL